MDRFETLLTAYLEGPLDAGDANELAELVKGQLIHRKRFLFQTELNGLLWVLHTPEERGNALAERTLRCLPGAANAEGSVEDIMSLVRALPVEKTASPLSEPVVDVRPRWSLSPGWVMVALVALLFGPALWLAASLYTGEIHPVDLAAVATLQASSGKTELITPFSDAREPARTGQSLMLSKGIETLGTATVAFRDETTLNLTGGEFPARVWLRNTQPGAVQHREHTFGKRVTVELGSVRFDVAKQPANEPMIVITPHAEVEVVGTVFSVHVGAGETEVRLEHGEVRVFRLKDKRVITLQPGQTVSTQDSEFKAAAAPAK